jgi:hypothetical protein
MVYHLKNNLISLQNKIYQLESVNQEFRHEVSLLSEKLLGRDLELEQKNEEFISLRYNIDTLESELYEMLQKRGDWDDSEKICDLRDDEENFLQGGNALQPIMEENDTTGDFTGDFARNSQDHSLDLEGSIPSDRYEYFRNDPAKDFLKNTNEIRIEIAGY